MHILIDSHLAMKEIDGVGRYLIGLLTELPRVDRSIRYTLLSQPHDKSGLPPHIFEQPNVERMDIQLMGPSPKQHFIMPRLFKEIDVDLYHHPQFDLPFGVPVPRVVTVHDLTYILHPEFFTKRSRLKRFYISKSLGYTVRQADRIIAVSENTAQDLMKIYGVEAERIRVIYHGLSVTDAPLDLNGLNISVPKDFILFVGTRRPHKNVPGLIKALAILRAGDYDNLHLVIAGKPYADFREPERTADALGVEPYVHFLDFVPEDQLAALYNKAKVVALPSFYEGFGFPLLEAMAYGKPLITSNVSALPEVVGESGLLVDPHNPEDIACKIRMIIANAKLANQLSQNARQRVRRFSWQEVAESTLQVYLESLKDITR